MRQPPQGRDQAHWGGFGSGFTPASRRESETQPWRRYRSRTPGFPSGEDGSWLRPLARGPRATRPPSRPSPATPQALEVCRRAGGRACPGPRACSAGGRTALSRCPQSSGASQACRVTTSGLISRWNGRIFSSVRGYPSNPSPTRLVVELLKSVPHDLPDGVKYLMLRAPSPKLLKYKSNFSIADLLRMANRNSDAHRRIGPTRPVK